MMTLKDRINEVAENVQNEEPGFIVSIYSKKWSQTKKAPHLSRETAKLHGASADMINTSITKIEKGALKAWTQIETRSRKLLDDYTVPYGRTRGQHFLPAANVMEFTKQAKELDELANKARKEIQGLWQTIIDQASAKLGDTFNPGDYPSVHEIPKHFVHGVSICPLPPKPARPTSKVLTAEQIDELERKMIQDHEEDKKIIKSGLLEKLMDPVSKYIEALEQFKVEFDETSNKVKKKNPFHDSIVKNIEKILEIVPAFNIDNDPKVEALLEEVKEKLTVVAPAQLRVNQRDRREAIKVAKELYEKMDLLL